MNEFVVTVNSRKRNVRLLGINSIWVDEKEYSQELYQLSGDTYLLKLDNKIYEISVAKIDNERFNISVDGKNYDTIVRSSVQEKAVKLVELKAISKNKSEVKAPMPGMVLKINKQAGDDVEEGESVMILEAMKMENDLRAHISGKIKNVYIKEGMTVEKGYTLFTIEQ
jgi:biotin carboxyl carrier protein